jgi:hypothetical protein
LSDATRREEQRDAHLTSPDFFDAERYPTITFESTRVVRDHGDHFQVEGDLTMRGVTRPMALKVERGGAQPAPFCMGGFCQWTQPRPVDADTYYIPITPHNPGGPICTLAAMHLAAAIPNFYILEQMEEERALRDELCTTPVKYQAGMFELPTTPGLGTDLRLEVLADRRFRPQPVSEAEAPLWR